MEELQHCLHKDLWTLKKKNRINLTTCVLLFLRCIRLNCLMFREVSFEKFSLNIFQFVVSNP